MELLKIGNDLETLLRTMADWATSQQEGDCVMDLLPALRAYTKPDWNSVVQFNKKHYTRKVIFPAKRTVKPKLEAVIFGWEKDQYTSVHGHRRGCLLKVLHGEVEEIRYCSIDNKKKLSSTVHYAGSITNISDDIGYHRVFNASENRAVTLHLYDRPGSLPKRKINKYFIFDRLSNVMDGVM